MEKSVKESNNVKLNDVARSFIEIALKAMAKATWVQTNGYENTETDLVKRMMEVTQSVGDLSREE